MTSADIALPEDSGNTVSIEAFVYVIVAAGDGVKVGVARDVWNRLKALQTGHYRKLLIAHQVGFSIESEAYAIEHRAHRLLKAKQMEGEWFDVSPDEARAAIEQAIRDSKYEQKLKEDAERTEKEAELKVEQDIHVYVGPEITETPPLMRDWTDITQFVLAQEDAPERKYLFNFGDCIIFVGCRKDDETAGQWHFFMNDVSRWHMQGEDGKPCDGASNSNPLGNPPCALFATVLEFKEQAA